MLERAKHPNADRIGIVFVDVGDGQSLQICCGAFNMQPGDLVPLATIGTVMPDGRDIQRSKMRGEWSNGMLCSPDELGLAEDTERDRGAGIYLLPADLPLGAPVFEALGITSDVVFELDLTRNRPECWGHEGVARDLAAHLGLPFRTPGDPDAAHATAPAPADAGHHRRRPLRPLHVHGDHRRRRSAVGTVDGRPADARRHAPDQQRGRRVELRDARAERAEPRLRPGHAGRRRLPRAPGPRR